MYEVPHTIRLEQLGSQGLLLTCPLRLLEGKQRKLERLCNSCKSFSPGLRATSRRRRAPDPRDPKASPVSRRAPPGRERAGAGSCRPPRLTFRQRVQHPRLLQVPPELLALRVGGLRRHGGSGTGAGGRSRKTARPAAAPKPCTRPNSHPAPPARPEPRRAPLTL